LGCGNGFKLAGLQKFLQQSLQYDVERVESLQGVIGEKVLNSNEFQENVLTFAVPLGLALQTLGVTRVHTSLLPEEIKTARLIRQKKPWAVIAASVLLTCLAIDVFPRGCVDRSVRDEAVVAASKASDKAYSEITNIQGSYDTLVGEFDGEQLRQQTLLGGSERAELIPEVFRAINECLPREVGNQKDIQSLVRRNRIHISYMIHTRHGDLKTGWFDKVVATLDGERYMDPTELATAPTGSGYVFTMIGEHYHKGQDETDQLQFYVQNTLLKNLRQPKLKRLGISHATLTKIIGTHVNYDPTGRVKMSDAGGTGGTGGGPTFGAIAAAPTVTSKKAARDVKLELVDKTTFKLEFIWKPTPLSQRQAAAASDGGQPGASTPGTPMPPSPTP